MNKEAFDITGLVEEKGPLVRLDERRRILGELAAAYANSASREIGLQKASANPGERRKLNARYGQRTDQVVKKARENAKAQRLSAEANVAVLTQSEALAAAGYPIDPETADQAMVIALRRIMGPGRPEHEKVRQKDRDAFIATIYTPEHMPDSDEQKTA